ncbi:hypothetical protein LXL04_024558 [Taraxacum kok-saghyz]
MVIFIVTWVANVVPVLNSSKQFRTVSVPVLKTREPTIVEGYRLATRRGMVSIIRQCHPPSLELDDIRKEDQIWRNNLSVEVGQISHQFELRGWELIEEGEKVFGKKFQELRMRNEDFKMSLQKPLHDSCQAMPMMDTGRGQTGLETLEGRFLEKASIWIIWNHLGNIGFDTPNKLALRQLLKQQSLDKVPKTRFKSIRILIKNRVQITSSGVKFRDLILNGTKV